MLRRITTIAMAILIVVTMVSCGGTKAETTELRVAMLRDTLYASSTQIIMKEHQLLEKYVPDGVTVTWSSIASNEEQRDALSSNSLDIGTMATPSYISARENGFDILPIVAYYELDSSEIILLYSCRDDITSIEELAGIAPTDKIAIVGTIGNISHLTFMMECEKLLGDARIFDSNMIAMGLSEALALAETSDELAAVVMAFTPGVEVSQNTKLKKIDDFNSGNGTIISARQGLYENSPELITAYRSAHIEAVEFISQNPVEAAEVLKNYWNGTTTEQVINYLAEHPYSYEISESSYDRLANFMYEIGLIDHEPAPLSEYPNYDDIPKVD